MWKWHMKTHSHRLTNLLLVLPSRLQRNLEAISELVEFSVARVLENSRDDLCAVRFIVTRSSAALPIRHFCERQDGLAPFSSSLR